MAAMDWNTLCDATHDAVEDVLDALGPLSRELGLAAGLENPAAPLAVALELLPEAVGGVAAYTRQHPFLGAAHAPLAVEASTLAALIVLLAEALLTTTSEAADVGVQLAA